MELTRGEKPISGEVELPRKELLCGRSMIHGESFSQRPPLAESLPPTLHWGRTCVASICWLSVSRRLSSKSTSIRYASNSAST
jgi:hypothetical protein